MEKQAEIDVALDASWIEMFRKPSYRKRVILQWALLSSANAPGVLSLTTIYVLTYPCRIEAAR